MHLTLEGKTALVTGGTRGIGAAISRTLAASGVRVLAGYRGREDTAEKLRADLAGYGDGHRVVAADVGTRDGVDELVRQATDAFGGRLDVLVHCAGVISHVPFGELDDAEWHRVLDTNLTAAYRLTRGLLPALRSGSAVTYVGSGSALVGIPLRAHYTAAKAALVGLARSLTKELGPRGVRVNVLASGVVDTGEPLPAEQEAAYRRRIPLGRLGRPEEIAHAVAFLSSDEAGYLTGATVAVDGGI